MRIDEQISIANNKMPVLFYTYIFFRNKYLRQPSMDFDFWNLASSGDVVYKDAHDGNTHGYWLTLRFCENFTCLSC